jgi:serine/threonine protein phosphatase PrpC
MEKAIQWRAGAASDTGRVRTRNEDRYWIDEARGVFLVVDGVGGHAAGQVAAQTAVEVILDQLLSNDGPAEQRIRQGIAEANNTIFDMAHDDDDLRGMACVLTLAVADDDHITVGHVGDSRLYLIWNGAVRKLTTDHSPVGEQEDAGELSEEEAMQHPRRNEVFRDVGSRRRLPNDADFIEIRRFQFKPDAAFLICSDGLTDQITSAELRDIVEQYDGDAESVATALVGAANAAGGDDNITALFVAGPRFGGAPSHDTAEISTHRLPLVAPAHRHLFTGRVAFLIYGLLIGMLVWAALHGSRG